MSNNNSSNNLSKKHSMAFIGKSELAFAFKSIGIETFTVTDAASTLEVLRDLVTKEYSIIFIVETLAEQIAEKIIALRERTLPAIVTIPAISENELSISFSTTLLNQDIKRAVGSVLGD